MTRYFDLYRADWDGIYNAPRGSVRARLNRRLRRVVWGRLALALHECKSAAATTLLDVGCGTGELALLYASGGDARAVGVDSSSEMIAAARGHATRRGLSDRCRFVHGDFLEVDLGESFDCTVALGVLDYAAQPARLLRRMWDVTRSRMIVSLPHGVPPRAWARAAWHALHGSRIFYYTARTVADLAATLRPGATRVHVMDGWDRTDVLVCEREAPGTPGPIEIRWTTPELEALLAATTRHHGAR